MFMDQVATSYWGIVLLIHVAIGKERGTSSVACEWTIERDTAKFWSPCYTGKDKAKLGQNEGKEKVDVKPKAVLA
jgi:hypothetical protein